jgi:hypothetical protein
MGMDVMGMNPINNEGETFHANLWSWRECVRNLKIN